jgi:hypothetical protein
VGRAQSLEAESQELLDRLGVVSTPLQVRPERAGDGRRTTSGVAAPPIEAPA